MTPAAIVSKLWNYCNVLRDDGMSYGDYVEQLTYLLFLKMADERGIWGRSDRNGPAGSWAVIAMLSALGVFPVSTG